MTEDLLCSAMVVIILLGAGSRIVSQTPGLKNAGYMLAGFVFFVTAAYGYVACRPSGVEDYVAVGLQSLVFAGLALGPCWMLLGVLHGLGKHLFWIPATYVRNRYQATQRRREANCKEQERRLEAKCRNADQRMVRERAASDRQQRTNARANVVRAYHVCRADLGDRFTQDDLSAYLDRFLSDDHAVADVQRHAVKLIATFKRLSGTTKACPPERFLETINDRLQEQRTAIEAAPVDDATKQVLLTELEEKYEEVVCKFIRESLQ